MEENCTLCLQRDLHGCFNRLGDVKPELVLCYSLKYLKLKFGCFNI